MRCTNYVILVVQSTIYKNINLNRIVTRIVLRVMIVQRPIMMMTKQPQPGPRENSFPTSYLATNRLVLLTTTTTTTTITTTAYNLVAIIVFTLTTMIVTMIVH